MALSGIRGNRGVKLNVKMAIYLLRKMIIYIQTIKYKSRPFATVS